MRPHLEYCVQAWDLQCRSDVELVGAGPEKAMRMLIGLEHLSYEDKLKELGLFNPSSGLRLQGDLIVAFQYLKRTCKQEGELFTRVDSDRTRGMVLK